MSAWQSRFLLNRDFARLWYGQAISTLGDFVFDTTITIWVAAELLENSRWGPSAVGGVMLCALLAIVGIGPLAGVFVDRWNRRRTMLASEVIRGGLVGVLTLLTLLPRDSVPVWAWLTLLYVVVFCVNAAGQFFNPARFATIGEIVPDEADRTRAFGLGQATSATAAIIGPPLAAPLLITFGIQWALLVNALSYVVSFVAVRSVRFPAATTPDVGRGGVDEPKPAWRTEFAAGLRLFAHNRFLKSLLVVFVLSSLGTGAMTTLLVYFVGDNLHVSQRLLGVMTMAYGLGSILGALLSGRLARALGARTLVWVGLILGGCLFALYTRQTSFGVALILFFVVGIPVAAMNAGLSPQILAVTPPGYVGRVIAVITPVNTAASAISLVVASWLASTVLSDFHATVVGVHIGRIDTLFTVSAAVIIIAGIYAALTLPRSTSAVVSDSPTTHGVAGPAPPEPERSGWSAS